ncbi:MAG TPA: methylmalonyl-CoA epimerase [Patescibacteria group bacterium]|nr:methylmalonyl-CoA epimerase [Patescibacteria group bacterium]
MIDAIDHIGIAVKNLDEAIALYRDVLGFHFEGVQTLNDRKIKIVSFRCGSESHIELVQPLSSDSAVAKFLENRGEGIHHFAIKVKNIKAVLDEYKLKGLTLIDEEPKPGAGGSKVAFIHPKSTRGVLLELVERP